MGFTTGAVDGLRRKRAPTCAYRASCDEPDCDTMRVQVYNSSSPPLGKGVTIVTAQVFCL